MIRKPAVAGLFYESNPASLKKRIKWCFQHTLGPGKLPIKGHKHNIMGMIVPHAGYVYSGPVAAHAYYQLVEDGYPDTFVILCPNHTGMGSGVSTMVKGEWETPLGSVEIDQELASFMVSKSSIIDTNPQAHSQEHSCEVHLPFLQYFESDFKIVPVSMWMQDEETSLEIGESIAAAAKELKRNIVIIASTDFTHYQPQKIAAHNDHLLLEAIARLDESQMYALIRQHNISMCGYGPVAAASIASKILGARSAEILKYATSGDITGDHSSVVGYGSLLFK
ncbi:MAG: AmmeMemoRadiSam system protein B [Euryarchaeota archaeon]